MGCRGYAEYYGHCGATDCETCYPGCNTPQPVLYTKTIKIEVLSSHPIGNSSLYDLVKLESNDEAYIHFENSSKELEYMRSEAEYHLDDLQEDWELNFDLKFLIEE